MKYIHSAGVIHRDLKPSDILINENADLKICDFGRATARIQFPKAIGYRAPEFLLGEQSFSDAVDIWSAGCIFAEMLEGKPLFPGNGNNSYSDITELLGTPPGDVIESMGNENLNFINSLPKRDKVPFSEKITNVDAFSKFTQ